MLFFTVIIIAAFAWYVMDPAERAKVLRVAFGAFGHAKQAASAARTRHLETGEFEATLRARTRRVIVTPTIALINFVVFLSMLGALSPIVPTETLLAWGASFGPLTSNGEWLRLLTAMFVHSGPFQLLINLVALLQVGLLLERLVGHYTFAAVYLISGLFAALVSLAAFPVEVSVGASGAIAGVYGLLISCTLWGLLQRSAVRLSMRAFKALAPVTAVFVLYNLLDGGLQPGAEVAGFLTGMFAGAGLARGIGTATPPLRRATAAAIAAALIAALCAFPLRGISDVRPELERLLTLEARITAAYDKAVGQFRLGRLSARQLQDVIDRTIMPELRAARDRIRTLGKVPREQQMLLASAEEYLTLRDESFRLRAEALRKSNMETLKTADKRERASLDALERTQH